MLIKWIVCKVRPENRSSFSKAQEAWGELSGAEGFIAQFGGWDLKSEGDACILGLWRNKKAYDHFMSRLHDEIFEQNVQERTYESISVGLFETVFDMPGSKKNLEDSLIEGKFLRAADCFIKPDHIDHFITAQQEVWMPQLRHLKFEKASELKYT